MYYIHKLNEIYRKLFRFDKQHVEWLAQTFLPENQETRGGCMSRTIGKNKCLAKFSKECHAKCVFAIALQYEL